MPVLPQAFSSHLLYPGKNKEVYPEHLNKQLWSYWPGIAEHWGQKAEKWEITVKMYILNSDLQPLSWLPFRMMTRRLLNCSTQAGSQRNAPDPVVVSEKSPTEGHQLAELHHTLEITLFIRLDACSSTWSLQFTKNKQHSLRSKQQHRNCRKIREKNTLKIMITCPDIRENHTHGLRIEHYF